jgi:ATP-dependent DNA helicase RecQ
MTDTSPRNPARLRAELLRLFGHDGFRPGQEEVVRAVLAGEDVLAVMPTGAGKSLCYQLPAMLLGGCTVVISPLVALMKDQLDSLPPALRARAAVFSSAVEREELDAAAGELAAGRLKLVYVAPERLRQRPFLYALARARIARLVVDEAHCISLWGHDFRPDYLFIPTVVATLGGPPVLAMTATATPALQAELRARFDRPLRVVHTGVLRPNLFLEVEGVKDAEAKLRRLVELCGRERGAGIVYVGSRERAEQVAAVLRRNGVNARHYHAGLESADRALVQDAFMGGRVRVIVATVAFGMGVDKPDVRFIVHFTPSRSLEAYAQESGRAGRDGRPARCVLLWTVADLAVLSRRARDEALTLVVLRAVYRAVRRGARGQFAWWPAERLVVAARAAGATGDVDETTVRVAVSALEQVGLLRRHCDLPETVWVRADGTRDTEGAAILAALGLAPGERASLPALAAAELLGCAPTAVEERLLAARDAGVLGYQGYGRGMLIELLPHPPDLPERLRGLLSDYQRAQRSRADAMKGYATARTCRTGAIARHFGVAHAGRCGHCDGCRGRERGPGGREGGRDGTAQRGRTATATTPAALPARAPEDIIIDCVAALPFPMGRTGITSVLKGSVGSAVQADRSRHFGALAALPRAAIEREIEVLVAAGYLARDEASEYRLLSVTPAGLAKPAAPWPSPRPAAHGGGRQAGGAGTEHVPRPDGIAVDDAVPPTFAADDPHVAERFERLRAWRRGEARAAGLPPYTVAHDSTLRLLAATEVTSLDDLARVKGVGPAKLARYGQALLELLRSHGGA